MPDFLESFRLMQPFFMAAQLEYDIAVEQGFFFVQLFKHFRTPYLKKGQKRLGMNVVAGGQKLAVQHLEGFGGLKRSFRFAFAVDAEGIPGVVP